FAEREQQAALFMADEQNQVKPVPDRAIAEMLGHQVMDVDVQREDALRLVFLAACKSASRSAGDAFRGLAPQLVPAGVPAVGAIQEAVAIPTALASAAAFYWQLLQHAPV